MSLPSDHAGWVLTAPGLYNSGPDHWQSWIERQFPLSQRVQQRDWAKPDLDEWGDAITTALEALDGPAVIVAHSFGCLATAKALSAHPANVIGALFVAPPDPRRFSIDNKRLPGHLPVPSIVVASENDPWMNLQDARTLAQRWGSSFVNYGFFGHINAEAGLGPWEFGRQLIMTLRACAEQENYAGSLAAAS